MIDLGPFCSARHSRLMRPYSIGAWTVATDAGIAVIVPRRDDVPERPDAPNIIGLFRRTGPRQWIAPPHVAWSRDTKLDAGCSVTFEFGIFAMPYVRAIWSLPDVRISPGETSRSAMAFTFDDGEGLVMPMTEPFARNIVAGRREMAA